MRISNRYIVTFEKESGSKFRTFLDFNNKKEVKQYCHNHYKDDKILSIERLNYLGDLK